jgi:hypothetical protein
VGYNHSVNNTPFLGFNVKDRQPPESKDWGIARVRTEDKMFNSNDFLISKLAEHREVELREKARIASLLAEIQPLKRGLHARFLAKSGEVLIFLGQKLKARYEPELNMQLPQSHPSLK